MSLGEAQVTIGVDDSGLNQKLVKVKNNILSQMVQMQKQIEATKRKAMQLDTTPLNRKVLKVKKDIIKIALRTEKELARIKRNALNLPPANLKPLAESGKKGGAKFSKNILGALQGQLGPKFGQLMGMFGGAGAVAMSGPILAAVAAVAVAVVAIVAAFKLAKAALLKFIDVGRVVSRLNSTLEITGTLVGTTTERVKELAREMSNAGVISEKQILRSAAILATFTNIAGVEFEKAVRVSTDLARAMGVDARTAALQLGKALSQPSTGLATLREAGIIFTASQREMILELEKTGRIVEAQTLLFEIMEENGIKKNAEATDSLTDKLDNLRNVSDNFLETLGRLISEFLLETGVIDVLRDVIIILTDAMSKNSRQTGILRDTFVALGFATGTLRTILKSLMIPFFGLAAILGTMNKESDETVERFNKIASASNNLRNILITNAKAIQDATKAVSDKEEAIFKSRGDRAAREIIKNRVFRKLKIQDVQDEIKDIEKAKKKAQAFKGTQQDIRDAEKNIEQIEGVEKAMGGVIKALRKRKLLQAGSAFSSAEGAFEQRIKRDAKALNDKRKMEKQALIEAIEAEKEKMKKGRDLEKEKLEFLNKRAKNEIELSQLVSDARIDILKKELAKRKELLTEFTQQGLENRELEILKQKGRETTKRGSEAIEGAASSLDELLSAGGISSLDETTKKAVVDVFRKTLLALQGPEGITNTAQRQGVRTGLVGVEGKASDRVVALEAQLEAAKQAKEVASNTKGMAVSLGSIASKITPISSGVALIAAKKGFSIFN